MTTIRSFLKRAGSIQPVLESNLSATFLDYRIRNNAFISMTLIVGLTYASFAQVPGDSVDESVLPAQYQFSNELSFVADPPTPTVQIQVRVPATVAPRKELPYRIVVRNTSTADAYRVVVRNPLPNVVERIIKAEPVPDNWDPKKPSPAPPLELLWTIGTLRARESRTIEFSLTLKPEAREIRNQAYVKFEHGQAVITKVENPKLLVRKSAPKKVSQAEGVAVVVEVANPGRVPVADVQLVEDISKGFEFVATTTGEKGAEPTQRLWQLGTLQPGERKVVQYRLTARDGKELLASSVVKSPDLPQAERTESTTQILIPAVSLDLTGPPVVSPGESAVYELVARNTGTLPLTEVRLSVSIPADCVLTKMTRGGQQFQDRVVWRIPRMNPGEAYSIRYGLKANTTGNRTIRAAIESNDGVEKSRELVTAFQGSASLSWETSVEPATLAVGKQGLLTVRVRNNGGEAAKQVRLRIELPPERTQFIQATPRDSRVAANVIEFNEVTIPAYGNMTYTITYRAERQGQAWFRLRLQDDSLGDRPLTKEQAVEILGSR